MANKYVFRWEKDVKVKDLKKDQADVSDDEIPKPTRLDLFKMPPQEWQKSLDGYREEVSATADPESLNYETMFSHSPKVTMSFRSFDEYREDVRNQAEAFLNSIPGADSDHGNGEPTKLARQIVEGRLCDLANVQKLDALLQRRGHMMRLAEWFLDQSSVFWVRVYHPKTTFSDGLYWWTRADEHIIGDIGWRGPFSPDVFEFDHWDFESHVVKNSTINVLQKYYRIHKYARDLKALEYACFLRPPIPSVLSNDDTQSKKKCDVPQDQFLGWDRELFIWHRAEGGDYIWDKPYKYLAAAFLVSGIPEAEAKKWIHDINWRYRFDLEAGFREGIFIRPRFAVPDHRIQRRFSHAYPEHPAMLQQNPGYCGNRVTMVDSQGHNPQPPST